MSPARAALALSLLLPLPAHARGEGQLGAQIVNLNVTAQQWDFAQPWAKASPVKRSAYATVVQTPAGPALLTAATMVQAATVLQVTKNGSNLESTARVLVEDREQNLALVTVDAPGFYDDLRPARFTKKPLTAGDVTLARWRGSQVETATGRVARPTVIDSASGVTDMVTLRVSTDMANGGAGEPAFRRGELVGVAQGQLGSELSLVPAGHLEAWLRTAGADDRPWVGTLGLSEQPVTSAVLVDWLGLDKARGLLITSVPQGSSACGQLRRGDVLLSVDGLPLDGEGNVEHPIYGRLYYEYLVGQRREGDRLPVQIWREGKAVDLQLPLRSYRGEHWLVPTDQPGPPPYLMAGGLVFRELSDSTPTRSTELRLLSGLQRQAQREGRRRIIVLSQVLPDPYNLGYHGQSDEAVDKINGQPIDSIDDVAAALAAPVGAHHIIELWPNPVLMTVVLEAAGLEAATARIAEAYGLPSPLRLAPAPLPLGPACAAGGGATGAP
jgi:hypothetical protein